MKLALDTNTYRAFMDGAPLTVAAVREADELHLPVPVLAELRFGFAKGTKGKQNEAALLQFLDSPRVRVLDCDEATTHFYAQLKLQLTKQGTPIPIHDVWIAALVLQHGATLHTLDRDFDSMPQLPRLDAR
ncbi:MAG: type II toxin-antitoxin system VapC family toxin [Myxococcales bacterium]|nr:type II toxin-antitoxin system VapC family toxin [Myxococcales bacterium]